MCDKIPTTSTETKGFRGNIMFASVDQLNFQRTTRKDDLVSLAYMFIYHANDQSLPFYEESSGTPIENLMENVKYKTTYSLTKMARLIGNGQIIKFC